MTSPRDHELTRRTSAPGLSGMKALLLFLLLGMAVCSAQTNAPSADDPYKKMFQTQLILKGIVWHTYTDGVLIQLRGYAVKGDMYDITYNGFGDPQLLFVKGCPSQGLRFETPVQVQASYTGTRKFLRDQTKEQEVDEYTMVPVEYLKEPYAFPQGYEPKGWSVGPQTLSPAPPSLAKLMAPPPPASAPTEPPPRKAFNRQIILMGTVSNILPYGVLIEISEIGVDKGYLNLARSSTDKPQQVFIRGCPSQELHMKTPVRVQVSYTGTLTASLPTGDEQEVEEYTIVPVEYLKDPVTYLPEMLPESWRVAPQDLFPKAPSLKDWAVPAPPPQQSNRP
jgi:hypothetical protein